MGQSSQAVPTSAKLITMSTTSVTDSARLSEDTKAALVFLHQKHRPWTDVFSPTPAVSALVSLVGKVGITLWSSWGEPLYDFRVACNKRLYHLTVALREHGGSAKCKYDCGLCAVRWLNRIKEA